ncbi:MAG: YitT family protein, partial [Spirochaetales bacterium]|nr:YitT family protein [Spirochaetales bacterium]
MGLNAVEIEKKIHFERFFFCMVGGVIYAVGVNMFIVPFNLYSGGIVGIAQLIRTLLADYIHLDFGSKDVAGIIFYVINVPILLYAFP